MKKVKRNQYSVNFLGLAFAIPVVGMLFVMLISKYEPFGNYSMLYSDMYHQYYPFFVAFRDAILSGNGLLYTWSQGLGMDYLGLISYYLASPLNLLSILVPKAWLLEYFSLMMPVKLGLASLFFAVFLKKIFQREDLSIAIFGGCYGLCAWALGYQWNIMWLDTFALLPLVVLGTISLLKEGKFILYTLTLFLSIYSNYYIGFFVCIFVFLLFFIYQICRWGGWRKFLEDLLRIALFSLIAIGMTAILSIPTLAALQTTQSSVNKFPTTFRLNIADEHTIKGLLAAMLQVAGNMGGSIEPTFKEGLPNVYCGIFSVMLMVLYLTAKEVRIRDKLCAVFLLLFFNVSFIIRQLDYIWHGFHFTNMIPYRFSFLYSFVVLYMAYRAWTLRHSFDVWQVAASGLMAAAVLACSEQLKETVPLELGETTLKIPLYLLYNLVFLVLYQMCMLYGKIEAPVPENATLRQQKKAMEKTCRYRQTSAYLLLAVMALELAGTLICFGIYFPGTGVSNYPRGTTYTESVIRYMYEREEETPFFRAETTHSQTLNDGALNGYQGVSAFTSSANVKTTLFMQSLGYGAKNTYNRYLFEESSPVANLFLGLKYMLNRDGKDKTSAYFKDVNHFGDTTLLENQAYLPLGFLAERGLAELTFTTTGNAFRFQNDLFTAATGLEGEVWHQIPQVTITPDGVTITESNDSGYCKYKDTANKSTVTYSYTADRDGFMCIHLTLPKRNDYYVSINGVELFKEAISLPQMMAVGDVKSGDIIDIRIVCDKGENSTMTLSGAILDPDLFRQGYEILNASTLELSTFESTFLEGTIHCDRDGLLYTSIPQNGNWSVTIDGEPAQVKLVGDCMVAVDITAGAHRVAYTYRNPDFALGWKISLASLLMLLVMVHVHYKPDWRKYLPAGK
nr:YfhO family protein [Oscillospiraceae bacterium]